MTDDSANLVPERRLQTQIDRFEERRDIVQQDMKPHMSALVSEAARYAGIADLALRLGRIERRLELRD